uniref:Interleukin-12 subunit alpha n=3 Tax=Paramormyrops kingsleyae TaxID=1676925 RepID=A0A3B3RZP1_9TELE
MLPNIKFSFIPWLLLVQLCFQPAMTSPLGALDKLSLGNNGDCATFSRALLWNVTEVMALDSVFKGINCSEQRIKMNTSNSTVSACLPSEVQMGTGCAGFQNSNLDQKECLRNVVADLEHYKELLQKYADPTLDSTVVRAISDLTEHCFSASPTNPSTLKNSDFRDHTFDERLQMCKILKGFQVRAITISRILSYISADTSKK